MPVHAKNHYRARNCRYAIDGDDEKERGHKQCDRCRHIHAELDDKYCGGRVTGGVGLTPKGPYLYDVC